MVEPYLQHCQEEVIGALSSPWHNSEAAVVKLHSNRTEADDQCGLLKVACVSD